MSKIELPAVTGNNNTSRINDNFQKIEDALNQEVLYRKGYVGEPNEMETDLDMNSNRIINLPDAISPTEPVTLKQLEGIDSGNALALRNELASASGSSLIGIGGDRTQADKNSEWISVTDAPYLVKFDNGITDNTAALNAAFQSGKKIWIPHPGAGNYASVSGPIYFSDNTVIHGPGKWVEVIRASATFPINTNVISPLKISQGDSTPTRGFEFKEFLVNANGWERSIGIADSCTGISLLACEDYTLDSVVSKNSPKWNFKCGPFNQFADLGHLGNYTSPNNKGLLINCHSEDHLDGDGFIFEGTEHVDCIKCVHVTTPFARTLKNYNQAHTGFQVVEGGRHITLDKCFVDGSGAQMTAYGAGSHINRPAVFDVLLKNSSAHGVCRLFSVWSDPSGDVTPTDPNWLFANVRAEDCALISPVVDPTSATLPARVIDYQYVKDSHSKNIGLEFTGAVGESPVAVINFGGSKNCSVDGFHIKGVTPLPANTYAINRNCGWVRTADALLSPNTVVKNITLDNMGYPNRVIHDSGAGAIAAVEGISVLALPADGQTKTGVVSKATNSNLRDVTGPVGFIPYSVGRSFTQYSYKNISMRTQDLASSDAIIGGLVIRSETLSGSQIAPGIIFDRQFFSSSDPTGAQGKGTFAWRTTAASEGRFCISAYHEDVNEFRPIVAARSTNNAKEWLPAIDNAVTSGSATNRFSQYFGVSGSINTSDAREKSEPQDITDAMLDAADEISISVWKWLDAIAKKGEDAARWHFGPIAQQVRDIFAKHGLDGCDYGLLCYDKWEDEFVDAVEAVVGDNGEVVERKTGERIQTQWAGDRWGIRPDQCLWLIAAAIRRRSERLETRLSLLEDRLLVLEKQ